MRMVIAYIHQEAFEPIRSELLGLGFGSLSIAGVDCSGPGAGTTMQYRGARLTNHLRPRVKLECVVPDEDVSIIVDTVLRHVRVDSAGDDRVFAVPVETFNDRVTELDDIAIDHSSAPLRWSSVDSPAVLARAPGLV